jgi:hypothetical protein
VQWTDDFRRVLRPTPLTSPPGVTAPIPLLPRSGAELSQPVAAAGSADQQTRDVETGTLLIPVGIPSSATLEHASAWWSTAWWTRPCIGVRSSGSGEGRLLQGPSQNRERRRQRTHRGRTACSQTAAHPHRRSGLGHHHLRPDRDRGGRIGDQLKPERGLRRRDSAGAEFCDHFSQFLGICVENSLTQIRLPYDHREGSIKRRQHLGVDTARTVIPVRDQRAGLALQRCRTPLVGRCSSWAARKMASRAQYRRAAFNSGRTGRKN